MPNPSYYDKPVVAAFDFDGTITTRDSLLPFLFYAAGTLTTLKKLTLLLPIFLGYLIGIVSRQQTKEKVLKEFFAGIPCTLIQEMSELFSLSSQLEALVRPSAKQRIDWHLQQGHTCVIVSASINSYLIPWGKRVGFHKVISSRLKIDKEGIVTGYLDGLNCWGPEKMRRLIEVMGPRENYILYAYGDSRGDQELLASADFAFYREMPVIPKRSYG